MAARQPGNRRWSRVIVTRPAHEAAHWVQVLTERGWPAQALPLIDITAPRQPQAREAVQQARQRWSEWDALMFVSAAAVRHFFDGTLPPLAPGVPGRTRGWAPGPGTARVLAGALQDVGLTPDRIDAPPADAGQFDSEHLWPVVQAQVRPGFRLLVVRGASAAVDEDAPGLPTGSGREWLIERCRDLGAQVDVCVAYERHAPQWSPQASACALEGAREGNLWLFSSSQALQNLLLAMPGVSWAHAAALCTHPRIADCAREAGFGCVVGSRPALVDVVAALESEPQSPRDI